MKRFQNFDLCHAAGAGRRAKSEFRGIPIGAQRRYGAVKLFCESFQEPETTTVPLPGLILIAACLGLLSCSIVETTYDVTGGTWKLGYTVTRFAGKTVYHVGKFTYTVVMAPLSWALTNDDIESIDGLPPKEAIRQGRGKTSPYGGKGKSYGPMRVEEGRT